MSDIKRILQQALDNAQRIKEELPYLIQPENACYDMILLADENQRLEALLKTQEQQLAKFKDCVAVHAMKDADRYAWLKSKAKEELVKESIHINALNLQTRHIFPELVALNCIGASYTIDEAIDAQIEYDKEQLLKASEGL